MLKNRVAMNLYRMPDGFAASAESLSDVGLDFDGDLGGLRKGPPIHRPRLHPFWFFVMALIPVLLIAANPACGIGFVFGAAAGATGMLVATLLDAHQ